MEGRSESLPGVYHWIMSLHFPVFSHVEEILHQLVGCFSQSKNRAFNHPSADFATIHNIFLDFPIVFPNCSGFSHIFRCFPQYFLGFSHSFQARQGCLGQQAELLAAARTASSLPARGRCLVHGGLKHWLFNDWLVVWNIFVPHIFQRGWNNQPDDIEWSYEF